MLVRFTQAARKHRVGRRSALGVMSREVPVGVVTARGDAGWRDVGVDERGRELDIVAVELPSEADSEPVLLVIHVMPTQLRK